MKKALLLIMLLTLGHRAWGQATNSIFPAQSFTASAQTGTTIQLNRSSSTSTVGSNFSVGTVTLTGTGLTTVTFAVMGSSDNGVTFFALPISAVASPGSTPSTTVTATAAGLYQVNLVGITHVYFVTSGTFTATSVGLLFTASPNGSISRVSSSGGSLPSAPSAGYAPVSTAEGTGSYTAQQVPSLSTTNPQLFGGPVSAPTGAWKGSVSANTLIPALNSFDVLSGSINTVVGSTDYQDDGLGGYITCHSSTVNCVGIFGAGYLYNQGGHAWGGNSIVSDQAGCTSCVLTGWESDVNTFNASDVAAAYAAEGEMFNGQPSSAVGFVVDIPRPTMGTFPGAQWTSAFLTIDGCCQNGFVTGSSSTAPSSGSMPNGMFSVDSGGTRHYNNWSADAFGNFVFQPSSGVAKFVNFVNALMGFEVNGIALAAANLSDGNTGTGAIAHKTNPFFAGVTFQGTANYNPTGTATSGANFNSYTMNAESEIWNGSAATPCNLSWGNIAASSTATNSDSYMQLIESGCPGTHWGARIGSNIGLIGDNGAIYSSITATPSLTGTYASTLVIPISNTYYRLTLTGNVNSSSIAAGTYDGQDLCVDIVQNATTAFTFSFPTNMHIGTYAIGTVLGKDNVICSKYNATATVWIAMNTGVINE